MTGSGPTAAVAALVVLAGVGAVFAAAGAPGSFGAPAVSDTPTPTGTAPPSTSATDATEDPESTTRVVATNRSLVLPASSDTLVRGETSLAPGTSLSVRLRSTGGSPFIRTQDATVAEDGTFRVRVDLSDVDPGTPVTVSVVNESTTLAERQATVVGETESVTLVGGPYEVPAGETLTVRGAATDAVGQTLSVRLHSEGDQPFILSRETTVTENGTFTATFDTDGLSAGSRFRVSVVTENGTRVASGTGRLTE